MIVSYGIIPLQKHDHAWQVLLVQLRSGRHWGYPKGHPLPDESAWQTAERELLEETNLHILRRWEVTPFIESYFFKLHGKTVHKKVEYFPAEVAGNLHIQAEEILAAKWVPLAQASQYITYPASKAVTQQVEQWIISNDI